MKMINIPLNEQEVEEIAKIDDSIRKRSMDLAPARLRARAIEDQIAALYDARNQFLERKVINSDINYAQVRSVGVTPDSNNPSLAQIVVEIDETVSSKIKEETKKSDAD